MELNFFYLGTGITLPNYIELSNVVLRSDLCCKEFFILYKVTLQKSRPKNSSFIELYKLISFDITRYYLLMLRVHRLANNVQTLITQEFEKHKKILRSEIFFCSFSYSSLCFVLKFCCWKSFFKKYSYILFMLLQA